MVPALVVTAPERWEQIGTAFRGNQTFGVSSLVLYFELSAHQLSCFGAY